MVRTRSLGLSVLVLGLVALDAGVLRAETPDAALRKDALRTLKESAAFFHEKVARHGGYVYYVSLDLQARWGEGKAGPDTVFVQPPGTPTVGMAFLVGPCGDGRPLLSRFSAMPRRRWCTASSNRAAGRRSFSSPGPRLGKYRHGHGGDWNASSLDDGQTQSALQMLVRADRALGFQHAAIHEAALYGLNALLGAQFPNGAFPQVWRGPVRRSAAAPAGLHARYPDYDWRVEGKIKEYWDQYTLNDGLAGTVSDTLIAAHQVYGDARYTAALEKLAGFLLVAQMPEPQPAWCQQYNEQMIPIWARKFEPPAVSGWESQDAIETLIKIARYTGERKILEPIPRA